MQSRTWPCFQAKPSFWVLRGHCCVQGGRIDQALRQGAATVQAVMTANAQRFLTPLTLQVLSGHRSAPIFRPAVRISNRTYSGGPCRPSGGGADHRQCFSQACCWDRRRLPHHRAAGHNSPVLLCRHECACSNIWPRAATWIRSGILDTMSLTGFRSPCVRR